ncbi:ABC transporter substrate-binding protein [Acrocarpospora pleiomorpha]|uniref:ABC transporter substrate-binding protein n=1 Tax=Acrocarpospora pleiomorpha TaxID=90975 RepID=A0A5M3Y0A4_9ACTN|nr:ABC transporter substrate-binding protein [Acrocarpospora pleiomorpha]GES24108.1 ABC transporter substrate-binding protein [Acrocarpospora pleiomorpha]
MRSRLLCCAVAATLLATGCAERAGQPGQAAASSTPSTPGFLAVADNSAAPGGKVTLQVAIDNAAAAGLDPQMSQAAASWNLMSFVYQPLVTVGPDYTIEPLLAEKWATPDPTTYVFTLRPGVSFSNGRALTADDVVGSMKRLLAGQSVWAGQLGPVESVEKTGDNEVTFKLKSPYTPLLGALANINASILPMKEIDEKSIDITKETLGTGPFVVGEHRQDVAWTFKKNPAYWNKEQPVVDTLTVEIVPQEATRLAALRDGSAQMSAFVNADTAKLLEGVPNVRVAGQATTDYHYLNLNSLGKTFADQRVRQAVNIALDRKQIAEVATGGQSKPTGVTPEGLPDACDPAKVPSATAGLEKAKALLKEAGAENLTFTLVTYTTDPVLGQIAQIMQQNLQRIGVTMKIELLDEGTWANRVYVESPPNFDASMTWFAGYVDGAMVSRWWNPDTSHFNKAFMKTDPELNALIEKAAADLPGPTRAATFQQLCDRADANAEMIPLATRPQYLAYRSDTLSPNIMASEGYGNPYRMISTFRELSR